MGILLAGFIYGFIIGATTQEEINKTQAGCYDQVEVPAGYDCKLIAVPDKE